jgi:mono/diheme cytochrome c family protein
MLAMKPGPLDACFSLKPDSVGADMYRDFLAASDFLLLMASAATAQDAAARGQAIVEQNCAGCHAVGKQGVSPLPAAPPFRTLGQRYPLVNLEEALAEGIVTGHPDMPPFAFEPDEVSALIDYLESIQEM